jgi:hypothetical protein
VIGAGHRSGDEHAMSDRRAQRCDCKNPGNSGDVSVSPKSFACSVLHSMMSSDVAMIFVKPVPSPTAADVKPINRKWRAKIPRLRA